EHAADDAHGHDADTMQSEPAEHETTEQPAQSKPSKKDEKRARADFHLSNDGTLDDLKRDALALRERLLLERARRDGGRGPARAD
ncbi:MAG: hypothetical protein AAF368_05450, partial [Planctomycetota bacterium]